MIRLLIVDDEENTRDGLKRFVPWGELGIDMVCEAEDGIEALYQFQMIKPNILLCDVRMPRMNGIELSEKIREMNSDCKIIFLSGFSDKEYLKSAIKVGAADYIEKPVVIKELQKVIKNAVEICRSEEEKKKREIVSRIMDQNIDFAAFKLETAKYESIVVGEFFTVAVISINWDDKNETGNIASFLREIISIIFERAASTPLNVFADIVNGCDIAVILNSKEQISDDTMDTFTELLTENLSNSQCGNFRYAIGIGKAVQGLEHVYLSYKTANEAAGKRFFSGYDSIIFYKDIRNNSFVINDSLYPAYESYLMEDRKMEAERVVRKLNLDISRFWGTEIDYIRHCYLNLYLILCRITDKRNAGSLNEESARGYFWKEISGFDTLEDMSEYLLKHLEGFFANFDEKNTAVQKVREIIAYIERYYAQRELTVKYIADQVHLSLNYMCGIFKKSTGETINEWIQKVRIQKACEILKDHNVKLYEIADMVGFSDSNYFTRIFKKEMGITPSGYREKYLL